MSVFNKPTESKRSFGRDSAIKKPRTSNPAGGKRSHRASFWPAGRLDYDYLESCKEFVCAIPHPNEYYRHRGSHYRLSILRWSRGSYIDIRQYTKAGKPTGAGMLLHIDVADKLLPELSDAIRKLVLEDTREPEKKTPVDVVYAQDGKIVMPDIVFKTSSNGDAPEII